MTHATIPCPTCASTGESTHEDRHAGTRMDTCRTCGGERFIPARTGETPEASFRPEATPHPEAALSAREIPPQGSADIHAQIDLIRLAGVRKLCGCGCGELSPLAQRNNARLGHIKGRPRPRISGHNSRGTANLSRFVEADHGHVTPCWDWTGAKNRKGYGTAQVGGTKKNAHRAVYESRHGELPREIHLDHLCRNKLCVNPEHMEPVTPLENEKRKRAAMASKLKDVA